LSMVSLRAEEKSNQVNVSAALRTLQVVAGQQAGRGEIIRDSTSVVIR